MGIRDVSNMPDDQVPEWIRISRERIREQAKQRREFLKEQKDKAEKEKL